MIKKSNINKTGKKLIGYWGCPPRSIIDDYRDSFRLRFIDLDEDMGFPSSSILPEAFCKIITNIINNAIALKDRLEVIIAAVGEDKCDSGRFAAKILKDMGFNIVETRNEDNTFSREIKIATSTLPLVEKVERIMNTVIEENNREYKYVEPTHGFWGVPPNDFKILEVFPDSTHVHGWTRCVEAGRPADLDLEMDVEENIPVVFYSQAFCGKQQLAKYLAGKYRGLYIDADRYATASIIAKIEAFLKLG
jgi:hypothetical protein